MPNTRHASLLVSGIRSSHNVLGILGLFPVQEVLEIPYERLVVKVAILCQICACSGPKIRKRKHDNSKEIKYEKPKIRGL
jgi:hypothetical protein